MKSTHIISLGIGWAATTPLYYTLSQSNQYLHAGHFKEFHYLRTLDCNEDPIIQSDFFTVSKDFHSKNGVIFSDFIDESPGRYPDLLWYSQYVKHFNKEQLKEILLQSLSIEKYIEYYQTHYEGIKDTFTATGNFSNWNANLSVPFLKRHYKKLTDAFDIKILMIFRDPVRRLFSLSNRLNHDKPKEFILKMVEDQYLHKDTLNYVVLVNRYRDIFGPDNVHYVIMEDFFSHQQEEIDKLSKFLNYQIKDIHPNVYTPDRGINAPKLKYLEDQWCTDQIKLEPEFYNYCREKMKYYYDDFEDMHGSLPADWGAPIDYGY